VVGCGDGAAGTWTISAIFVDRIFGASIEDMKRRFMITIKKYL